MAAINKIEYIYDSTKGIAKAGETITIDEENAKIVKEDADAGVTEELTSQQTKLIDKEISNDNTTYDNGNGDTPNGEITEEMMNEEGQQPQISAGMGSAVGGVAFGALTFAATNGMKFAMNSFTAPVVGGIDVALGALSLANVAQFDVEFVNRVVAFANAEADQSSVLDTEENLNESIESLKAEQANTLNEAPNIIKTNIDNTITQDNAKVISANTEKEAKKLETNTANQIKNDIDDSNEIEEIKTEIETNEDELTTTSENAASVAEFLEEGNTIGALGLINTAMLIGSAVNSGIMIGMSFIGINPFTIANAFIGASLCSVATGLFSGAAAAMAAKSGVELAMGAKGTEMLSTITEVENSKPEIPDVQDESSANVAIKPENTTGVAFIDGSSANANSQNNSGDSNSTGGGVSVGSSSAGASFAGASSGASSGGSSSGSGSSAA